MFRFLPFFYQTSLLFNVQKWFPILSVLCSTFSSFVNAVDPLWIENLNSVLDDNKILTLSNGDRLQLLPTVKLIFEPQDLDNASPATVSRCGMVYMSSSGLDWHPLLNSWLMKMGLKDEYASEIKHLFESSFMQIYKWATSNLHFVMHVLQINVLQTLLVLMEGLLPCLQRHEGRLILAILVL